MSVDGVDTEKRHTNDEHAQRAEIKLSFVCHDESDAVTICVVGAKLQTFGSEDRVPQSYILAVRSASFKIPRGSRFD